MADEQALVNGFFDEAHYGDVTVKLAALPFKFSESALAERRLAPVVGGDSREVLAECGYSKEEIDILIEKGIVRVAG